MGSTASLLVILLSIFSASLCNGDAVPKNAIWSSLTPLQLAAMEGRTEEVEEILQQKKESVNRVRGMSALHWAALRGHVPVIQTLLKFGADIGSLDDDQNTALHMAAVSGSPEAVQELVLARVDLNAQNSDNSTALHLAVGKEDFQVVKKLLRFGAFTNITDRDGRSPLDLALETDNNFMVIALLRSAGAKKIKYAFERSGKADTTPMPTTTTKPPKATRRPEVRNLTAEEMRLHQAASKSLATDIADMCAKGLDPNVADIHNNGFTPVHLAAAANSKRALLALARCSANLNAKDFDGNTPLHIAVIKDYPWSADMLILLGAKPDITNNEGKLPKNLLTKNKNEGFKSTFGYEFIKWISGIRKLSTSERKFLGVVQKGYYMSIAETCRKREVDIGVKDVDHKQYTMLHYAVSIKYNVPTMIQTLLRCGADLNARDAEGNTPLHLAVILDLQEPAEVLLLNGADPYIANATGHTAHQVLQKSSTEPIDSRLQWYMNSMPV